ncbi:N-acyl amino acid synthase FeeM domain-containing protein [Limnobacter sp.]|uniref:N-acyl amino acid synthase FeeM domain-containing protein n=1 Tax=Limnobacter sp. TaxID=2003368 RepID=UPI002FE18E54
MATPTAVNFLSDSTSQLLPFWIAQAKSDHELELAAKARQIAYGRHLPEFGERLATPDDDDRHPDSAVLLAFSKLDGSCIGTVRIQIAGQQSIRLEESFALPDALHTGRIAEISRLAIPPRSNGLALRLMLIKAAYWYSRANEVDRCFLCVRHPVDRQYRRFDLHDVLPAKEFVPMQHIGMIPHRIFWFDVFNIEQRWLLSANPLHSVYFANSHPDLLDNIQACTLLQEAQGRLRSNG